MKHLPLLYNELRSYFLRNLPSIALLTLFCVIPFNIAYHFDSSHVYVEGRFVNYLDFVVHVVDIGMVLWLAVSLWKGKLWKSQDFLVICGLTVTLSLFQYVLFHEEVVAYNSARLLLYVLSVASFVFMKQQPSFIKDESFIKGKNKEFMADLFLFVIAGCAVFQSLLAVFQFASGHVAGIAWLGESVVHVGSAGGSSVYLSDGYHLRGYGTFPHPNVLGGYLVVSLFALLRLHENPRYSHRIMIWPVVFCVFAGIVITWSRVAWVLAFMIGVSWVFRFVWKNHRKYLVHLGISTLLAVTGVTAVVLFGTGPIVESVCGRLVEQSSATDVSVTERKELAERAIELFRTHPWSGIGLGRFVIESSHDPVFSPEGVRIIQPVHNVFILMLSEVGIVGVSLLGAVLYVLMRNARLTYFTVIGGVIIVCIGMFDHYLWTLPQGMALVMILTVCSSLGEVGSELHGGRKRPRSSN